jgi:hypothetical protein
MPATGDRITKRKDGHIMARYTVHTPDGPKRKVTYGKKYKVIEKKLAEAGDDMPKELMKGDDDG